MVVAVGSAEACGESPTDGDKKTISSSQIRAHRPGQWLQSSWPLSLPPGGHVCHCPSRVLFILHHMTSRPFHSTPPLLFQHHCRHGRTYFCCCCCFVCIFLVCWHEAHNSEFFYLYIFIYFRRRPHWRCCHSSTVMCSHVSRQGGCARHKGRQNVRHDSLWRYGAWHVASSQHSRMHVVPCCVML